jgi:hypothetical protein
MNLKLYASGAFVLLLICALAGCNPYALPGPLHYGKCGADAHTEAYPYAKEERHAYGCKSDDNGFLEGPGQGDQRRN